MNIFGFDLGAIISNPIGIITTITGAAIAIIICPHLLNYITTWISNVVLWIDNAIIDLIPIRVVKDYFQNQIINMLRDTIEKYKTLIKKISD